MAAPRYGARRATAVHARAERPHVCILSTNRATLDGLQSYFRQAGIPSLCHRSIGDLQAVVSGSTAVVVFPDEFTQPTIDALLDELSASTPETLLLLVTGSPQHYRTKARTRVAVFPKPSFGWDILDAVRAHAERARA